MEPASTKAGRCKGLAGVFREEKTSRARWHSNLQSPASNPSLQPCHPSTSPAQEPLSHHLTKPARNPFPTTSPSKEPHSHDLINQEPLSYHVPNPGTPFPPPHQPRNPFPTTSPAQEPFPTTSPTQEPFSINLGTPFPPPHTQT